MNGNQGGMPPNAGPPGNQGENVPGEHGAPGVGARQPGQMPVPPPVPPTNAQQPPPPPQQGVTTPQAAIPTEGALPPLPRRDGPKPKKQRGAGIIFVWAVVGAIIGALLVLLVMPAIFGVNPYDLVRGNVKSAVKNEEKKEVGTLKVISPSQGGLSVSAIAQKVTPSIVNIDIRTAGQQTPFFTTQSQEGTGSGIIYSSDGYIITNNHVVKIDKTGLPTLQTGNSDNLVVGELAVAIGSPFGFEQTVTSGIISALHRSVGASSTGGTSNEVLTDLIQTDAAINPGNSGGALCDGNAKLIGINAVIATSSGGSEGIGFAIPVNTAISIADSIIGGKPVSHPYLGVQGQTVSQDIATQYNLPVTSGAYITSVIPGGPADKVGMKSGDIIVAINGQPVKSMDDVVAAVRKLKVGDKVSVTYYQGSSKKTAEVKLQEKPANAGQ